MANKLIIGLADKTPALKAKQGFLLIDDGPTAETFLKKKSGPILFDPLVHSFNPLPMSYRKARDFAATVFGDKDLMTYRNGRRALTRLLIDEKAKSIDQLRYTRSDDDKEARGVINDLLLSPVLRHVLCDKPNFTFKDGNPPPSIVARINRAELGDHDAKILGCLLISQFKGQIIVPDFGFYAREFHASLIRENRLIAGVYTLSELDEKLRNLCLLMPKIGKQCTFDDAETLAKYAGLVPRTEGFKAFVVDAMA